jgi:hypothetical protein
MKSKLPITLVLLFTTSLLFAQPKFADKLIKRDSTIINCEVREIGDDEIKYSQEGLRSDILIGIDKNKVARIIFDDGRVMKMEDPMAIPNEDYKLQRKNALKYNFLLPVSGAYAFSYERSLKPGRSLECEIGIISSGESAEMSMKANGQFIKIGFKLIKSPDFYLKGMKYAHILKGSYIKPELALSAFTYDKSLVSAQLSGNSTTTRGSVVKLAFLLNTGKQVVYSNRYVFDWFIGAGYVLGDTEESLRYFAFTGGGGTSFVMNGGVRVGLLFK